MILYFSGTGNSEYVAKRIAKECDDEAVNLFEKLRERDFSDMHSDSPWVIAAPTYGWRIPRILNEWLQKTKLSGEKTIYFVLTCGGAVGNAEKYLKELCFAKNMKFFGCRAVVMPENYIALFNTPGRDKALEIIDRAEKDINEAAAFIKKKEKFLQKQASAYDKILSGIVNDVFYSVFVHAKKFYAEASCVSCGKCVKLCPLNNIRLENGKPVWGDNCTHCMACICRCPQNAVEYGRHSKGQERYVCPK